LLFPGAYLVLTEDKADLLKNDPSANAEAILELSLPNFPADEGRMLLRYGDLLVDSLVYSDDWHFPLLKETRGVSLERIRFDAATTDPANWHSASAEAGFATPTAANSQAGSQWADSVQFTVWPEVFSPDLDGRDDIMFVSYQLENPDYVANLSIYDWQGRPVRSVAQNHLLGTRGQFKWDGLDDFGAPARIGIYLVVLEVFNLEGALARFQKPVVLAAPLD
jgi:hypothetical protein